MAVTVQATAAPPQFHRSSRTSRVHRGLGKFPVSHNGYFKRTLFTLNASSSSSSTLNQVLPLDFKQGNDPVAKSSGTSTASNLVSGEAALILLRHGESQWNERNLFTGCVDVPLTIKGVEEAIQAGRRISHIPIDVIYTSTLIRAQMTAMLAMTQCKCSKVPIIVHNESEQARLWSQIYSVEAKKQSIPVIAAAQLNERMYGELQGLNKRETSDRYGNEKVLEWRRSFGTAPPNGESLEMCACRAVSFFRSHVVRELESARNVMVAAHGNSLRSIIMFLDNLTPQEIVRLELPTGVPVLYIFKQGKFSRMDSATSHLHLGSVGVY